MGNQMGPATHDMLLVRHACGGHRGRTKGALCGWLDEGRLRSIETIHEGVAEAGVGFCHLFEGRNFGKSIVRVRRDAGLQ